jgi:hypothetical protein
LSIVEVPTFPCIVGARGSEFGLDWVKSDGHDSAMMAFEGADPCPICVVEPDGFVIAGRCELCAIWMKCDASDLLCVFLDGFECRAGEAIVGVAFGFAAKVFGIIGVDAYKARTTFTLARTDSPGIGLCTTAGTSGATDSLIAAFFATAGCGVGCLFSVFGAGGCVGIDAALVAAEVLWVEPLVPCLTLASSGCVKRGVVAGGAAIVSRTT